MPRLSVFVLPLLCVACLIVMADEPQKEVPKTPKIEVPAKPKAAAKKIVKAAQVKVQLAVQFGGMSSRYGAAANDREDVRRTDNIEKFVLLAPRGPIVVEATISLDGQPFRVAREKLVDEMIAAADSDGDGKSTWKEAVDNRQFVFGRANFRIAIPVPAQNKKPQQPNKPADKKDDADDNKKNNKKDDKKDANKNVPPPQNQVVILQLGNQNEDQKAELIKYFDKNKNGLVDRSEARAMLARTSGGPTFSVFGAYSRSRQPDVKSALDKDKDGKLSPDELELAGESLKSRDANDNDLLEPNELGGTGVIRKAVGGQIIMVQAISTAQSRPSVGHLLGPTADHAAIFTAMQQKYGGQEGIVRAASFSLFPGIFAQLDANANGQLEKSEVTNLEKTKPHIRLQANVGSGAKQSSSGILIQSIATELANQNAISDKLGKEVALALSDVKLRFVAPAGPTRRYDYSQTSKRMIDRYDTNKNGYIEEKEMAKVNIGLKQQFQTWDANSDGKVYAKEITESYRRQQAPMLSRVSAQVGEDGPSLFSALDQSGDQRLSLREMRTAGKQLIAKDKNGDGHIGLDEMPIEIHVSFGQGNGSSAGVVFTSKSIQARAKTGKPKSEQGPEWFTRMDRNGDGDVTLREFLGNEEQFKKLDANGDGFIELKEASAMKVPGPKSGE